MSTKQPRSIWDETDGHADGEVMTESNRTAGGPPSSAARPHPRSAACAHHYLVVNLSAAALIGLTNLNRLPTSRTYHMNCYEPALSDAGELTGVF